MERGHGTQLWESISGRQWHRIFPFQRMQWLDWLESSGGPSLLSSRSGTFSSVLLHDEHWPCRVGLVPLRGRWEQSSDHSIRHAFQLGLVRIKLLVFGIHSPALPFFSGGSGVVFPSSPS